MEVTRTFSTREVMVPFNCNVHAWMNAYVGAARASTLCGDRRERSVLDSATAAGTLTLEIWHERLGTQTQQVTVAPKETKEIAFTYKLS